jgi:glutathione synthase/RimK-type ligase-like ATP-grasp enzyme
MNYIVALLFSIHSPKELPFADKTSFDSYHLLWKFGRERDIDIRFVLGEQSQDNTFSSYWKFEGDTLIQCDETFSPHWIWLQTRDNKNEYTNRVNSPFLEEVCRDKYKTAQVFPQYCKKTILVTKESTVSDFMTDRIVIKPQFGSGGREIQIISKEAFTPETYPPGKFIAQEFIESEKGIPGLIDKRHEIRVYVFTGVIKAAYLRVPAEGSYIANIAQGAKEHLFDLAKLPKEVYSLKDYVDNAFSSISPRLYTMDVMFENGKPWIVELNDTPGMPDISVQPLTNIYLQELLTLFESN